MAVLYVDYDVAPSEYRAHRSFWNGYKKGVESFNLDCSKRGKSSAVRSAERASSTCRKYVNDPNYYFCKKMKKLSSSKSKYYDGYASALEDCIDDYYTTRCVL